MRAIICTSIAVIAMAFASAAQADTQTQTNQLQTLQSHDSYGAVTPAEKQRIIRLIYKHFGSGYVGRCMVRIAARESGFNERAVNWNDQHANGPGSFGVMQLGRIHVGLVGGDYRRLWDAETNIRAAKRLYQGSGFGPWRGCP